MLPISRVQIRTVVQLLHNIWLVAFTIATAMLTRAKPSDATSLAQSGPTLAMKTSRYSPGQSALVSITSVRRAAEPKLLTFTSQRLARPLAVEAASPYDTSTDFFET